MDAGPAVEDDPVSPSLVAARFEEAPFLRFYKKATRLIRGSAEFLISFLKPLTRSDSSSTSSISSSSSSISITSGFLVGWMVAEEIETEPEP